MSKASNTVTAMRQESVEREVAFRERTGMIQVTLAQLKAMIREIGYRFDPHMSCKSMARYLTGERAGHTYPNNSLKPTQVDDGLSYSHVCARRDANFERLTEIRNKYYAVRGGYICGW